MTGMFEQVIQTYRLTERHLLALPLAHAKFHSENS
jgi:hypothetical protein